MATNQDFDNLIQRINTATDTLEVDVANINTAANGIGDLVQQAITASDTAVQAVDDANNAVAEAEALLTALEQTTVLEEAPKDGEQYARKDGAWVVVTSSGDGGGGDVSSVNGVLPDSGGNVTLTPADIGAASTDVATTTTNGLMSAADKVKLDSVESGATAGADWNTNVTNKPTILPDAPADGKQYARKDNAWTEVAASGGGSRFPVTVNDLEYNSGTWGPFTEWPFDNPQASIGLASVRYNSGGTIVTGAAIFNTQVLFNLLPEGKYWFGSTTFPTGHPLRGKAGYIQIQRVQSAVSTALAVISTAAEATSMYTLTYTSGTPTWKPLNVTTVPRFSGTAQTLGAVCSLANQMKDATINWATFLTNVKASIAAYGAAVYGTIASSGSNPPGGSGLALVKVMLKEDSNGDVTEVGIHVEMLGGTNVGKRYFATRSSTQTPAQVTWVNLSE